MVTTALDMMITTLALLMDFTVDLSSKEQTHLSLTPTTTFIMKK